MGLCLCMIVNTGLGLILILKLFQETKQDSRKSQAVSLMCIETKMTENGAF